MLRLLPPARTACLLLLAVFGVRAVVTTPVVRLDADPAGRRSPGPVTVSLAAPGGTTDGVSFDTPGLAPGDTVALRVDLVMRASSRAPTATLTTTATSSSLLDQDPVDGLQLAIDRCGVPWEKVPAARHRAYRCPGRRLPVLAPRPILGRSVRLSNLDAAGKSRPHLLLLVTLPRSAGNEFQGLSSRIDYAFSAK